MCGYIGTYRRSSRGEEDERAQVSSALVAQRSRSIDQSANSVGLDCGADDGRAPGGSGGGGFLRLDEFLVAVGFLGAAVGLAEERSHDSEGGDMIEDGAEGDGGGLDGWEVWRMLASLFH